MPAEAKRQLSFLHHMGYCSNIMTGLVKRRIAKMTAWKKLPWKLSGDS